MARQDTEPRWLSRIDEIDSPVDEIRFPRPDGYVPTQDRERFEAVINGERRRMRIHDYHEVYKVPGLYERVVYEHLKCCSPSRVVGMLDDVMDEFDDNPADLKVLDVGAGNGMVGDELERIGVESIVGMDIIKEAKVATLRDRPGVYDAYLVTDLTDLPEEHERLLREKQFNCLTVVAALGFGDIPPKAFVKALDLISTPGWVAFNIKEQFLNEQDDSGFCELVRQLSRDRVIQMQAYRRYQHRVSIAGKPLYYVAAVAKKLMDIPDHIMEAWGL
ncbi:MAG TPA: class I SAM-dependent methyltransferase [Phycisphaerae bacterium]|nr:class I SAM-dependent methyltransferase [Phycisphaerae bacterium]